MNCLTTKFVSGINRPLASIVSHLCGFRHGCDQLWKALNERVKPVDAITIIGFETARSQGKAVDVVPGDHSRQK